MTPPQQPAWTKFSALGRLGIRLRTHNIRHVEAMTATDCGPACLAMVLAYHGKVMSLEEVRKATGCDRDGTDALALVRAAGRLGLRGRGLRIEVGDLGHVTAGTILHWNLDHFVVFKKVCGDGIEIDDPQGGLRRVSRDELDRSFTGVALVFERTEKLTATRGPRGRLLPLFRPLLQVPGLLVRVVVMSLLVQVFGLAIPAFTSILVDRVVPRHDNGLMLTLGAGFAVAVLFGFLTSLLRAHTLVYLRTRLDASMTLGFLDHLMKLPYAFFQGRPAGDLLNRIGCNSAIREILTSTTMSALLDGVLVTSYLLLLIASSTTLGLLVVLLGMLQVGVYLLSHRFYRSLMARELHSQARSESYLVEVLSGVETLKALGIEDQAVERWSHLFVDELNVSLRRGKLSAAVDSAMSSLQVGSMLAVLWCGAMQVLGGNLSLGAMLGLSALASGFLNPLGQLVASGLQLQLLRSYSERLGDVLEAVPEQPVEGRKAAGKLTGKIKLEHVSFRYGPLAAPILEDLTQEIGAECVVAIVGRSGAGKSTFARLLLGLFTPTKGRVLYDGQDLAHLDARSVRSQVGIVPQDPRLFAGAIHSNIALGAPGVTLEQIEEAARLAAIHEEIVAMPMGYDTLLGEGGSAISAGQRQRIALARALVRRPKVLLLDEATSALDAVTERVVQEHLAELRCTRIVIAHRLSTVMDADLILVLEDGGIKEQGNHTDLIERDGIYARLVAAQLAGENQRAA